MKTGDEVVCLYCGKTFIYEKYGRVCYCSYECARKQQQIDNKARYIKKHGGLKRDSINSVDLDNPKTKAEKSKKKPKYSIAEISVMARNEHLTYGQYVKKYGL